VEVLKDGVGHRGRAGIPQRGFKATVDAVLALARDAGH
jgi:hypothetical protein